MLNANCKPDALEKICTKCKESLPADTEFFYADKRSADGLRGTCKVCYSELPSVLNRQKGDSHGG